MAGMKNKEHNYNKHLFPAGMLKAGFQPALQVTVLASWLYMFDGNRGPMWKNKSSSSQQMRNDRKCIRRKTPLWCSRFILLCSMNWIYSASMLGGRFLNYQFHLQSKTLGCTNSSSISTGNQWNTILHVLENANTAELIHFKSPKQFNNGWKEMRYFKVKLVDVLGHEDSGYMDGERYLFSSYWL